LVLLGLAIAAALVLPLLAFAMARFYLGHIMNLILHIRQQPYPAISLHAMTRLGTVSNVTM
jgi:hypothetical protein